MTTHWTDDPQVRDDAALAGLLRGVATLAEQPIDPASRARDLEAMLTEAARPSSAPVAPAWRSRARRLLALTGVKVVLAAGVATAATGTMAATGTLPDLVQGVVHDLGARVGIGFPAAPGQVQKADETGETRARDVAPGQQQKADETGETRARDLAPGRVGQTEAPGRSGDAPGQAEDAPDAVPGDHAPAPMGSDTRPSAVSDSDDVVADTEADPALVDDAEAVDGTTSTDNTDADEDLDARPGAGQRGNGGGGPTPKPNRGR